MGDQQRHMLVRAAVAQPGKGRDAEYSDEWYTPPALVASLGLFDLDPCAGPMTHARENWRHDGLARAWFGRVWLNPPYSDVRTWLTRMVEHGNGIAIVNARPETQWFQSTVASADAVLWILRRVEFLRPDGTTKHTPVGQVLIAWGARNVDALESSGLSGLYMTVIGQVV